MSRHLRSLFEEFSTKCLGECGLVEAVKELGGA